MSFKDPGYENIHKRLHQAIDELRKDVTRVEIWATALWTFATPVPEYRPNPQYELEKALPRDRE